MNQVIEIGRLTRDPEVRYTQNEQPMAIARYTLAVDRPGAKDGQQQADFISCKALGKNGEFAEKYLKKGMKIAITGSIQTGSYTNKDGQTVYTTEVLVNHHEFCESKGNGAAQQAAAAPTMPTDPDGFMNIPDGEDEELPFT